ARHRRRPHHAAGARHRARAARRSRPDRRPARQPARTGPARPRRGAAGGGPHGVGADQRPGAAPTTAPAPATGGQPAALRLTAAALGGAAGGVAGGLLRAGLSTAAGVRAGRRARPDPALASEPDTALAAAWELLAVCLEAGLPVALAVAAAAEALRGGVGAQLR